MRDNLSSLSYERDLELLFLLIKNTQHQCLCKKTFVQTEKWGD